MKVGELANALGVSRDTIKNWVGQEPLSGYFSDEAHGRGVAQRYYNENDVLILNTINYLRNTKNVTDWRDISSHIEAGEYFTEFPKNAIASDPRTIPVPQAEQAARYAAIVQERDNALEIVDDLRQRLIDERARADDQLKYERERNDMLIKDLQAEIARLNREIGRLEGKLED